MRLIKVYLPLVYTSAQVYPAPTNLTYFWSFGIFALCILIFQIVTGIFLSMFYSCDITTAFSSVERIMRDITLGWLLRYSHANGASFFFIVIYVHIFRGIFYGSYIYPRRLLWTTGVIILLLLIITAFLGYILPWGQMSYWGATVITNLVTVIPIAGQKIVYFLWGGFSVGNPTLTKFFSLHFLLPFVILALVGVHLYLLHSAGSSNPLGISSQTDSVPFHPYYSIKDLFSVILFFLFLSIYIFFLPNALGHSDNYLQANSAATPEHIVPEWYFLPFYAVLRAFPNKLLGVILLLAAILVLLLLPIMNRPAMTRSKETFVVNLCLLFTSIELLMLGGVSPDGFISYLSRIMTFLYFYSYFMLLVASTSPKKRSKFLANAKANLFRFYKINPVVDGTIIIFAYNFVFAVCVGIDWWCLRRPIFPWFGTWYETPVNF